MYLAGDVTDEIILSFPPSTTNKPTEKMIIVAQGVLGENEEFVVWRWTLPSESSKALAAADQPLTAFYKPVGTPSQAPVGSSQAPSLTSLGPSKVSLGTSLAPPGTSLASPGTSLTSTGPPGPQAGISQPQSELDYRVVQPVLAGSSNKGPAESSKGPVGPKETSTEPSKGPAGPSPAPKKAPEKALGKPQGTKKGSKATDRLTASSPAAPAASPPIQLAASSEQATLSISPAATPASPAEQPQVTGSKIVDGVSEPAVKYTKLSGLVKKSLTEFKVAFETNFPGHDMVKCLEAAHCVVVEDKVTFIGGS